MRKVWSNVMLVLLNVTIKPSDVRKKEKKRKTECDKITVTCDVSTIQYDVELSNVRKKN